MSKSPFISLVFAALAFGFNAVGCAFSGSNDEPAQAEAGQGELRLGLVTGEQTTFRLRQAHFQIEDRLFTRSFTLDSNDADGEETILSLALPQDRYFVELVDGWVLERLDPDGYVPVPAALLTENPQAFEIKHGRATSLAYTFTTADGIVRFGEGTLDVMVDVVPIESATGTCNPTDLGSCATGQTCLLADGGNRTFCADAGALPAGSPCSSEQCEAGTQCLRLDPEQPDVGTCTRFCNPLAAPFDCTCRSLDISPELGVCELDSPSGVVYSHTFASGARTDAASCNPWHDFRRALAGGSYSKVILAGSLDPVGRSCTDPEAATAICNDLANGATSTVECDGHTWFVGGCGSEYFEGSYRTAMAVSVDASACQCGDYAVRPCMDVGLGGTNAWGGAGVSTCSGTAQTLHVACFPASE